MLYLGADRYHQHINWLDAQSSVLSEHIGSEVIVAGTVGETTFDRYDQARLRIEVDALEGSAGPIPAGGSLLAWTNRDIDVRIGERVVIRGRFGVPAASDAFDPVTYLRAEDVTGLVRSATVLSRNPSRSEFPCLARTDPSGGEPYHRPVSAGTLRRPRPRCLAGRAWRARS